MKQRDFYFDNARFILMFFVVFGHFLRTYIQGNEVIYSVYKVIYTFHMPAFILISGYFSKGFRKTGYVKKLARKLILPYLLFQTVYTFFYYFLYNETQLTYDLLEPHWSLWFLISLFFWNIMLYLFTNLKNYYAIFISLILSLAVGYFDNISDYLSLSRTFVFFPLFLIGYYLKKDHFYCLLNIKTKLVAVIIYGLVFTGFYFFPSLDYEWLLGSKPYAEMDVHVSTALLIRFSIYILSIIMMTSFFALIPSKRFFFTNLGRNTLYVYLLHGFIIRLFRESDVKYYFTDGKSFLSLAIIALLLTIILSSQTITSITQPVIELKTSNTKKFLTKIKTFNRKKYYQRESVWKETTE